MNKEISWDHSLVKKYSSSNHFKLLNQLKNEVKKYPLNNKKNISYNKRNNSNDQANDNLIKSNSQDTTYSKISDINNDISGSQSTVSFNNSKNFSIYNSMNKDSKELYDTKSLDVNDPNEEKTSSSFKDRLNQVDMK